MQNPHSEDCRVFEIWNINIEPCSNKELVVPNLFIVSWIDHDDRRIQRRRDKGENWWINTHIIDLSKFIST